MSSEEIKIKRVRLLILVIGCLIIMLAAAGCKSEEPEEPAPGKTYEGYKTYVFFGSDSRSADDDWKKDSKTGEDEGSYSDVIMLLSVNEEKGDTKIVSVYRDTMLDVAGDGSSFEKCNHAFKEGGSYGAIDMLERNLDLQIDGYATANFMTVANAIDMLGGVEVDVEDEKTESAEIQGRGLMNVVDTANSYIDEMNSIYETDTPHIESAGLQTLSGLQAVAYSRVRYTEGSDMRRTERQRNIVALMADKLKASDTETQHRVLKQMYQDVETDLAESELMDLFDLLIAYDLGNMEGFPYHLKGLNDEEKGYMLVPCDLAGNTKELHASLYNDQDYTPGETVVKYDELIKEETGLTAEDADE